MGFGPLADRGNALAFLRVYILEEIPHKKGDAPFEALIKKERAKTGNDTDYNGDNDDPFRRGNTGGERKFHVLHGFFTFSPDPILVFLLRAGNFPGIVFLYQGTHPRDIVREKVLCRIDPGPWPLKIWIRDRKGQNPEFWW